MSQQQFNTLMGKLADSIAGLPLDQALEDRLNADFAVGSDDFQALSRLCAEGEAEGWLMAREAGGIKFGRAVKPGSAAGSFSVDVVRMKDVRGPHHIHTTGEIGAIMPLDGAPRFDGKAAGWYVYGPGSQHHPTVTGGDAYILYLLPEGAIEFTGQ
ncbi:hypothetical protein TG4357_01031 [Thalassovita gelatinovora]|uniref:2-hydroxylaminobenzoate mutase n=1 Tax=Thalassovita gelatinovora TaxID=53501 RepID=A0A0P1F7P1_THAGE|nr:DUF4863 family protein [Thalassovita gelatinovora]CUH64038.1 hypothetical protein TG4357_01031 [Thalassovita gelatinovora]SEQ82099.1 protein of unknown function [Thalassovita gelatinovora]